MLSGLINNRVLLVSQANNEGVGLWLARIYHEVRILELQRNPFHLSPQDKEL